MYSNPWHPYKTEHMNITMKIISPLKTVLTHTLCLFTVAAIAQEPELAEYVDDMQSLMGTVEANGRTYRQTLVSPSPTNVMITVNEINAKGEERETEYTLALSDINPRAVRSFPKGDIVMVEIVARGNQKLIKKSWDGGGKIAYIPDFMLYATSIDNGGDLKQAFQESVPFAVEVEQKGFGLETYEDHLNWLTEHIGAVTLADGKVEQRLTAASGNGDAVTLRQVKDGRINTSAFNLSELNPNSSEYHVSGDELFIEIRTKGGTKAINYSEDGALRGYRDFVTLYAGSPEKLKKIQTAVKKIIPLAEGESENAKAEYGSGLEMLDAINRDIDQVATVDGRIQQRIGLNGDTATISVEEITDKRHLEHEYSLTLTDINALGIKNEESRSRRFLELPIKNGQPFIRHIENGEPQNYRHYLRLYFGTREAALDAADALKTLITEAQAEEEAADGSARFTLKKGWANLETLVADVENSDPGIAQRMAMTDNETSALTYTKTVADRKNTKELLYEFGAKEINPYTSEVHVSGPRVWVELITKNKQKTIKVSENGELRDYRHNVEVEANSIANAKDILKNFKKLSELYGERIGQ